MLLHSNQLFKSILVEQRNPRKKKIEQREKLKPKLTIIRWIVHTSRSILKISFNLNRISFYLMAS